MGQHEHQRRLIEIEDALFGGSATQRIEAERAAREAAHEEWRAKVGRPAAAQWDCEQFIRGYNAEMARRAQRGEI